MLYLSYILTWEHPSANTASYCFPLNPDSGTAVCFNTYYQGWKSLEKWYFKNGMEIGS